MLLELLMEVPVETPSDVWCACPGAICTKIVGLLKILAVVWLVISPWGGTLCCLLSLSLKHLHARTYTHTQNKEKSKGCVIEKERKTKEREKD